MADVLHGGAETERIATSMREADLVIDFSASPAVVGHLADQDLGRAASFFFGPDGSDLDGAPARPSNDDEGVFSYLHRQLDPAGAPYAMLICGREETWLRAAWQDRGQAEAVIAHVDG